MRKPLVTTLIIALFLSACGLSQPEATPTPTEKPPTVTTAPSATPQPPTDTPEPSPSRTPGCVIGNAFLEKLNPLVPYEQFALHHNTIQGIHSLTIWFVDPSLDTEATADTLGENLDLAIQHAAEITYLLHNADRCAKTEFTVFNPIVVDSNYVEWYSGTVPPAFVPSTPELSDTQRAELIAFFKPDYVIDAPPAPTPSPPAGACTWPETEAKIREHFSDPKLNNVFFFIRNRGGNAVWAQWYLNSSADPFTLTILAAVNILDELDCLSPRPDALYTIVLNPSNDTLIFGFLPRTSDQHGTEGNFINGFDLLNQYRYAENP